MFDDFDAFMKQAIRDYYDRSWKSRRGQLHRAGHRVGAGDVDGGRLGQGRQRFQEGGARRGRAWSRCASASRYALSGPLGIILTGAAAVALAGYFIKHQKEIRGKVGAYRALIVETRTRFEEAQGGYRAGRYDAASRNLMVDGLLKRFLDEVDAATWRGRAVSNRDGRPASRPRSTHPLNQHQRLEAADGEADQQARTEHVLDLAAAVLGVDDDLAGLVALLRIEHADVAPPPRPPRPARAARRPCASPRDRRRGGDLRLRWRCAPAAFCLRAGPVAVGVPRPADLTEDLLRLAADHRDDAVGGHPPQRPHQDSTSAPTPGFAAGARRSWDHDTPVMRRSPGAPPPATAVGGALRGHGGGDLGQQRRHALEIDDPPAERAVGAHLLAGRERLQQLAIATGQALDAGVRRGHHVTFILAFLREVNLQRDIADFVVELV